MIRGQYTKVALPAGVGCYSRRLYCERQDRRKGVGESIDNYVADYLDGLYLYIFNSSWSGKRLI